MQSGCFHESGECFVENNTLLVQQFHLMSIPVHEFPLFTLREHNGFVNTKRRKRVKLKPPSTFAELAKCAPTWSHPCLHQGGESYPLCKERISEPCLHGANRWILSQNILIVEAA